MFGHSVSGYPFRLEQEALLKCRVTDPYATGNVSWYVNDTLLTTDNTTVNSLNGRIRIVNYLRDWFLLVTPDLSLHRSVFTCTDGHRIFASEVMDVELAAPEINNTKSSLPNVRTDEFSDVTLNCIAIGNPAPLITWSRRSRVDSNLTTDLYIQGETLVLHNVTRFDSDFFICNASNKIGWDVLDIEVVVHFPIEATVMESEVSGLLMAEVAMTCAIQGISITSVYWESNNKKRINQSDYKYLVLTEKLSEYPVVFTTLVIQSGMLGIYDFGTYRCFASTGNETISAEIKLMRKN